MRVRPQPKLLTVTLLILVLAISALQLGLVPIRYFDPDEFQHLHSAWCISKGMLPYKDYFEHHTPLLHFLLAPWFLFFNVETDPDQATSFILFARLWMWILTGLIIYLMFAFAKRLKGPRVAWWSTLFLATTPMFLEKSLEIRPDVLSTALWLGCLLSLIGGIRSRGHSLWSFAWSGFFLGLGVMCTQKMLFAIPGFAATLGWHLWRQGGNHPINRRFWTLFYPSAGFCLPILVILSYITMRHGLSEFIECNFLMNFKREYVFIQIYYFGRLLAQSPFLVLFGTTGFLAIASTLFHRQPQESPTGEEDNVLLILNSLGLLGGLFLNPIPHRQAFLPLLPLAAVCAAISVVQISEAAVELKKWVFPRVHFLAFEGVSFLVVVLAAGVSLIIHRSSLIQPGLCITVLGTALYIGIVLISGRGRKWVAGIVLVALCAHFSLQLKEMFRLRNTESLSEIRYILVNTRPDETVMDGWTGLGVFRPHAWFFYFLHSDMRSMMTREHFESLYQELLTGRVAPRMILFDHDLNSLSPEITDFFKQHYTPVGLPHIWVRKTE